MKKLYESPEIMVTSFEANPVLLVSNGDTQSIFGTIEYEKIKSGTLG